MKRVLLAMVLLAGVVFNTAAARPGFGLGLMLGEPSGLSAKAWLSPTMAIDAGVAFTFWQGLTPAVHADLLFHNFRLVHVMSGSLPFYIGVGARARIKANDLRLGVRVPLGMEYLMARSPFGLFAEIAPIVDFTPKIRFDGSIAVGFRYYFGRYGP